MTRGEAAYAEAQTNRSETPEQDEEQQRTRRRRGRRPQDASVRRDKVLRAVTELEEARVPFSMSDVAERAGISRATLYRDAGLRDLIGSRGDGPESRPVDARAHRQLQARVEDLAAERRALRRALRQAEKRARAAESRNDELEAANAEHERARRATGGGGGSGQSSAAEERLRAEAYAEGFAAGARSGAAARGGSSGPAGRGAGGAGAGLLSVAARLPRPALTAARRTLARAIHPDLFATEPATALLATELLKQINALAGPPTDRQP